MNDLGIQVYGHSFEVTKLTGIEKGNFSENIIPQKIYIKRVQNIFI